MTPRIFVSATSKDLSSARAVVTAALLTRDCMPVAQDHFPPDTRTIRAMLRRRIKGCDAVIHLVGECYGAEPGVCAFGEPRRSYTQMEYDMACELRKPVYRFICAPGFLYDPHAPEPADLRALQDQHRVNLTAGDDVYYAFNEDELKLRVRELQEPVEKLRRTLRKARCLRLMTVSVLVTLLLGVLAFCAWKGKIRDNEIAALRVQMSALPDDVATRVTAAINRRLLSPSDLGQDDPAAAAQAQVAGELGVSVEAIRQQLATQRDNWREMMDRINQYSASADAQAHQWHDLRRDALTRYGNTEYASGHYVSAIDLYRQALPLYDEEKEPLVWCAAAQRLESALDGQWRVADAVPLARRLLEKYVALLGADNPRTLDTSCALADALTNAGGYPEAEALYRRVLDMRERTLGRDDPKTVCIVNNLAALLVNMGRPEQAEPLYRRGLEASERVLGENDSQTLICLNNLATLLAVRGDRVQAEPLFRRVLATAERMFGSDHPNTMQVVGALAHLLLDKGDLVGAEPLFRRAYETNERMLGDDQPITLISLYNLAGFLRSAGNLPEAERLYRRCLVVQDRLLGPENRGTLKTLNSLAGVLYQEGQRIESDRLFRRCLEAVERLFGKRDRDTATVAFDFSLLKLDQGQRDDALALAQEAVTTAQASLPADDSQRLWYERYFQAMRDGTVAAGPN